MDDLLSVVEVLEIRDDGAIVCVKLSERDRRLVALICYGLQRDVTEERILAFALAHGLEGMQGDISRHNVKALTSTLLKSLRP